MKRMAIIVLAACLGMSWMVKAQTAPATAPATASAPASAPATAPATTEPAATAPAPTARAVSEAAPTSAPADDKTQASDSATATKPADAKADRTIRFQFDNVPCADVVRRFAQLSNKPLIGQLSIDGYITFFDSEPYTYEEALDMLNLLLGMRGYMLVESGRYFRLISSGEVGQMPLKIMRGELKLDDARPGELITVVLPLKFITPADASRAVVRMVSTFGSISPLDRSKGIIITDRRENIERIRSLLKEMDSSDIADQQIRIVQLQKASAKSVADTVSRLFGGRGSSPAFRRGPGGPPQQAPQGGVTVVSDDRTNMLLLMGSGDELDMAEQMAKQLDTADIPGMADMKIFVLQKGRAEEMVQTITAALPRTATGRNERGQVQYATEARVVADVATNRLVVSAPIDQMPAIEKLIKELDDAVVDAGGTRVIKLKVGDAQQIARVIEQAFSSSGVRGGGPRRPGQPAAPSSMALRATAETRTNSIILVGSAADMQQAVALIDELDRQEGETREIQVVHLKAGQAREIARSLERIFAEQAGGGGPRGGASGSRLRVEAENETNTLIISAAPSDWPTVRGILDKLETAIQGTAMPVTRLVPIKNGKASEIARTLQDVFARRSGGGGRRGGLPASDSTPVVISANDRSNSLLIQASETDHATLTELIREMDIEQSQALNPLQIIRLQSADAEALAAKVQAMIPRQRGDEPVLVQADKATNSVLLRAPVGEREAIEKFIAQLDEATRVNAREMRMMPLKNASAAALAQTLGQLYAASSAPARARGGRGMAASPDDDSVTIAAAPGDKTLIVEAPQVKMEQIAQLVRTMDADNASATMQIRTYQLDNSDAAEVARALARLFAEQQRGGRGQQTAGQQQPKFESDRATNQLMIAATAEQMVEIEQLIAKLQEAPVLASQTRTFDLKHARGSDIASMLTDMLQDAGRGQRGQSTVRPRVAAMSGSNSVVVQGSPEAIAVAQKLIETFDVPEAAGQSTVQIVRLSKAQSDTLARAVNEAIARRNAGRRGAGQEDAGVSVTAEPNSNSLLVRGPAAEIPPVIEMIKELDQQSSADQVAVRVIPLANTDAADVAKNLEKLFRDITQQQSRVRGRSAPPAPFSISSDYRTNSLVISTTPAHFTLVDELLASLDKQDDRAARDMQYYWLKNADAWDVERQLNSMFSDRRGPDKPIITGDIYTNAITVIARDVDLKEIEPMIAKLDEAAKDNSLQVRVLPLSSMPAEKMAAMLVKVYGEMTEGEVRLGAQDQPPQGQPSSQERPQAPAPQVAPAGDASSRVLNAQTQPEVAVLSPAADTTAKDDVPPPVTIAADKTSNSLIISATRRDLDAIESLIYSLSSSSGANEAEMEVIPIRNSDPVAVAKVLNDLFNPRRAAAPAANQQANRRGGTQPNQAQQGRGQTQPQPQQAAPAGGTVTIVADARTRNLIVRAKPMEMEMVRALIEQLDQKATVVSEVQVFKLQYADATEVAANLKELFRLAAGSNGSARREQTGGEGEAPANAQERRAEMIRQQIELRATTGGAEGEMPISVSANRQSNSIVVAAPTDAMGLVRNLVQELDQSAAGSTTPSVKMYPLKHAQVSSMVSTLSQLFTGSAPAAGGTAATRRGQPARAAGSAVEPPTSIVGDESARLVIVSAGAEKHELIAQVIADLDNAQAGEEATVKVYRLENADAQSVATALTQTLAEGAANTGGRGGRTVTAGQGGAALRISADRSGNSIIARASADDHKRIAELIAEMDSLKVAQQEVRLIPLNNANPTNLAQTLRNVLGLSAAQRGGRGGAASAATASTVIEADADSRMLMVRADDEMFDRIRALAAQLDAAPTGQRQELFVLGNARATTVAAALSQAFSPPRGQRLTGDELVTVVAESGSNSLIVTANQVNMDKVKALIVKLDGEQTAGLRTEMLLLKQGRATDIAATLSKVAPTGRNEDRVVVTAEEGSNALVFSGPSSQLDQLMKMALQLDQASSGSATGVHILQIKQGDAATTANMIRDLYNQQAQMARAARRTVEPLAVSADARANAVVLACSQEMFEQVRQWVGQVETMQPERGKVRLIHLENVDPVDVQKAIEQLFGGETTAPARGTTGGRTGTTGGRTGTTGGRTRGSPGSDRIETSILDKQKALLVTADDEDYETILQLVATLDAAAKEKKRQVKVFQLIHADNTRIAQALSTMYRAAGTAPEDQVNISALPSTTTIVVTASAAKMEEVEHLIAQLDKPDVAPKLEFRVYPLTNTLPTKILPTLRQMLQQVQRSRPDTPIDVQADERTRSIIVTSRDPVFEQIEAIIKSLDKAPAYEAAEVLIVPLKRADAQQLATVLTEMLRPSATNAVTPEARALQEQVRLLRVKTASGEQVPELDLTKPIKVQADSARQQGSNALVITSTPDNLKAMQAVVEILDAVPLTDGCRVRVLALKNADAETVATTVRQIFQQGRQLAGKQGSTVTGRAEPETTTGKALVNVLNVSPDVRTNSVIISGFEESVALAELLVKDLDREEGKFVTEVKAFRLSNADAARLVPVLSAVFAEGQAVAGAEGLRTQVTRLMTKTGDGQPASLPKPRAALTIQADATTNIILVAARSDVMPLIADVIKTMDVAGAGSLNSVRICTLTNADATRIRTVLTDLYSGPNASLIRQEDRPTITVDTRTNALVISANDKTFAVIDTLLKTLDAKQSIDTRDIRLVPLENAEAASLATTLQRLMDARVQRQATIGPNDAEAMRVMIVADPRSNSLIVGGSAESFEIVKTLALQLDGASPALGGMVQIFPLTHGNAGNLATTLTNLFTQRYQAAATPDVQRQRPIILPDLRTNSLLVAANKDDSKMLTGLLAKLDVKLTDPAVQLVVLPMKHNDSGVVGPMIQQIFQARLASMTAAGQTPSPQDRVDVATDSLSNALIISASKENLELINGLLSKVDIEPPLESGLIEIFGLNYADAPTLASMLQALISNGLYKPGAATGGNNAAVQAREKVSIAADIRTNVLIVSASKENLAVIKQIVTRLDREVDPLLGDIRVYQLKRANAARLGPMLQQFFANKRTAEMQVNNTIRVVPVVVVPDERTNTLLVAGGKENFAAVEAMIDKLDGEAMADANEFRVFYLKQATATAIQPMLTTLFSQRVTRGTTKDPITVLADAKSNALIVGATADDMKAVESLVTKLDSGPDRPGYAMKIFPLERGDATQIAQSLQGLMSSEGTGSSAGIGISVDQRTNSIVVSGGESDIRRIGDLIAQLDRDTVNNVTEIKVFALTNADATELAQILNDSLNNKPQSLTSGSPNRQSLLQFITQDKNGRDIIASGLQEGVIITPDRRTNSLVLAAPRANMPLLESLIKALDSTRAPTAEIRVFPLQNADATRMATVLQELFKLTAAANSARAVSYTLVSTQPVTGPEASAVVGTAQQSALTITVDARTNSLLVGGTRQYIDLVNGVIQELDASPAQERITQVYRLRNAQASDVQSALNSFLDQERQRLSGTVGADAVGSALKLMEREVAVVAVQSSDQQATNPNTLLLSASPRYFKTLMEMVKELDQPPPQVLIQVLLAEVTLDNTLDLGVDWNYTAEKNGKTYGVAQDLGVQGAINQFGGFSVSVTGGDFNFFLRAMQAQGRMEVLSRPQILASDNVAADINVGQRVPFVTNSRIADNGAVSNTIQYQDVGIILRVTPRINPDGFVRLEVNPEISSISTSSVQISEGVRMPIINNRSATTTVTVQDGHTIVIGGLITTRDDAREEKVPLLGDIPWVGNVFKTTTRIKERTELLIILTPYVLRCPEEADAATDEQLDRLNLLRKLDPEDLKESLLKRVNGRSQTPVRQAVPPGQGSVTPALEGATCPVDGGPASNGKPIVVPNGEATYDEEVLELRPQQQL